MYRSHVDTFNLVTKLLKITTFLQFKEIPFIKLKINIL